jgi:ABC-type sulfate transport system permease component
MLIWLIGVAVFVVLWGTLWRAQPGAGFGVLIGLPFAWLFSRVISPYITGMHEIPIWLPPLPLAIVALTLFVFGTIVWFRADKLGAPKQTDEHEHGHH